MSSILYYFQDFFQQINKGYLLACTLLAALLVIANYRWGIESRILMSLPNRPQRIAGFYLLYLLTFGIPCLLYLFLGKSGVNRELPTVLILIAPLIFALKASAGGWQEWIRESITGDRGRFIAIVSDWPIRFLMTVLLLWLAGVLVKEQDPKTFVMAGFTAQQVKWMPYFWMVLGIIPLVSFAASQPAFLQAYPKLRNIQFLAPNGPGFWQKLLYELSYGIDFLTIEIFFRGFLVIIFARYIGPAAVLPMAVFYCSIHFGKPMLECISSYFGGILLGVIACYSQSIYGGIIVHLSLAWMMELAAFVVSHRLFKG